MPLAITVLVVQNGQGIAVLGASGHAAPINAITAACGAGSIVNIASVAGLRASPMQGIYGATKAAVISMTQTLAFELGDALARADQRHVVEKLVGHGGLCLGLAASEEELKNPNKIQNYYIHAGFYQVSTVSLWYAIRSNHPRVSCK